MLQEIVFDCEHAPRLARFWASAIDGYAVRPYDDAEIARLAGLGLTPETDPVVMVDGDGPSLCFQQVDEPKRDKNRVHIDLRSDDRHREVERLSQLGATVHAEYDDHTVLLDPEDNEFCVYDAR